MISMNQIARMIDHECHAQLIDRILSNGRCRSALVRQVLMESDALPTAALGLALQRISEMTYRPEPLSDSIAQHLLTLQRADGLFAGTADANLNISLAATAVAVRGLITHQSQRGMAGFATVSPINTAVDRALDALAFHLSQNDGKTLNTTVQAIILWQLGDVESFRARICIEDVVSQLDEAGAELLHDDLCRFAHAMAA